MPYEALCTKFGLLQLLRLKPSSSSSSSSSTSTSPPISYLGPLSEIDSESFKRKFIALFHSPEGFGGEEDRRKSHSNYIDFRALFLPLGSPDLRPEILKSAQSNHFQTDEDDMNSEVEDAKEEGEGEEEGEGDEVGVDFGMVSEKTKSLKSRKSTSKALPLKLEICSGKLSNFPISPHLQYLYK